MQFARLGSPLLTVFLLLVAFAGHAETSPHASDLQDTSWQLVKFGGGDNKILTPHGPATYTVAFQSDGAVSVRIDCNRGHGARKSSGPNQLEFGPLALTRAMCPPSPLNDRLPKDWQNLRSYVLKNGHLFLSLMADAGIYEFEPAPPEERTVGHLKGSATYRERMALPDGAVLVLTLEDVSRADARSEVIARVEVEHPGNPPIAFDIPYDPSRIHPNRSYTLRARIEVDGKLLFTTDRHYPVLGADQSSEINLLMKRVGTSSSSPAPAGEFAKERRTMPLENTEWKLARLGATPVQPASAQQQPSLVLDSRSQRVSGSAGCNRITGGYELQGDHLTFTKMASTMMACVSGMDTERIFLDALQQVRGWKITGDKLELVDATGQPLAQFQAHPMK